MSIVQAGARRSLAAAFAGAAARAGARAAGNYLGNQLRSAYNSYRMPRPDSSTPMRRIRRRNRAQTARASRAGRARSFARRRFARKVRGRYRGRRYTDRGNKRYRSLNTNITRNDYRSLRVLANVGSIEVGQDTALVINNFRFPVSLATFKPQWDREFDAYDEYKLSNIQFVLRPRTVKDSTNGDRSIVTSGEIPYLACRSVNPNNTLDTMLGVAEINATPGFRFIKMSKKTRTIFNVAPAILINSTLADEQGGTISVQRHRPMPWMERNAALQEQLQVAAIEIRKPLFESGSGQLWKFDVMVYATVHLRGNKAEGIEPY